MKRILILCMSLVIATLTFGSAVSTNPPLKASDIFIPVGKSGKMISWQDLADIKVRDFEILTGKPMSLIDKASFKLTQRKLRGQINRDGTVNEKRLERYAQRFAGDSGFHLGGFLLGFILLPFGVLIAYLINDDYKANRVKWAWIGLSAGIGVWLLIGSLMASALFF